MTTTPNTTVKAGDRVQITAVQSYDITWDDSADYVIGEYGVLLEVRASALAENTATGTYDCTPYKVRLDNDEEVWVADVMPEVDGLRRTIAELDKTLDDQRKHINELETQLAAPRILTDAEYDAAHAAACAAVPAVDSFAVQDAMDAALLAVGILPPPPTPAPDTCDAMFADPEGVWHQCAQDPDHDPADGHHNGEWAWLDGQTYPTPEPTQPTESTPTAVDGEPF